MLSNPNINGNLRKVKHKKTVIKLFTKGKCIDRKTLYNYITYAEKGNAPNIDCSTFRATTAAKHFQ